VKNSATACCPHAGVLVIVQCVPANRCFRRDKESGGESDRIVRAPVWAGPSDLGAIQLRLQERGHIQFTKFLVSAVACAGTLVRNADRVVLHSILDYRQSVSDTFEIRPAEIARKNS